MSATTTLERRGRELQAYFTADELMRTEFPEPKWAVPGLLAEGLNLLVGSPKIGKSWMCLGLAVAVASGSPAFGRIGVDAGDVLYAALEDTPRRLKGRLTQLLSGARVPERLHIATLLPRGNDMITLISEWLDAHPDARLVIIDVLKKVTPRTDGRNAYEADYEAMSSLKGLADSHGVCIVAVHHSRKQADDGDVFNEVSGSTGLTGASDAILFAKRARNTSEAVLHVTGRDVTEQEYQLAFDAQTGLWKLLEEPPVIASMSDTRRRVVACLSDHPGSTPTQIANRTGIALDTIKQTVRRMVTDHQLETDGSGHYTPSHTVTPVTAVTEGLEGDSGDVSDSDTQGGDER